MPAQAYRRPLHHRFRDLATRVPDGALLPFAFVQSAAGNTGATAPATFTATLPAASTTGNLLLVAACSDATVATPSGWTRDELRVNTNGLYLFRKTSAGETAVELTPSVSAASCWAILEYTRQAASPLDVHTSNEAGGVSQLASGTTGTSSGVTGGLAIAVWGGTRTSGTGVTFSGYTNSFSEVHDTTTTRAGAGNDISLAVATRTPTADGTFASTATASGVCASIGAVIALYKAA